MDANAGTNYIIPKPRYNPKASVSALHVLATKAAAMAAAWRPNQPPMVHCESWAQRRPPWRPHGDRHDNHAITLPWLANT